MNKREGKIDLSIVITAHSEGLQLNKTLICAQKGAQLVGEMGDTCEIIIHIDNGTDETRQYLGRYSAVASNIRLIENSFGDPALSRNAGIKAARGKYVVCVDGGDMISPKYYSEGLKQLKKEESDVVLHPKYCLTIDRDNDTCSIWCATSISSDRLEAACELINGNHISVAPFAKREIFLKYPYRRNGNGYGYEDYNFNIETTNAGVRHVAIDGVANFYLPVANSVYTLHSSENATVHYSPLFDLSNFKRAPAVSTGNNHGTKQKFHRMRRMYIWLRDNKVANAVITPVANIAKAVLGRQLIGRHWVAIPDYILSEWRQIAWNETRIYPTEDRIARTTEFDPQKDKSIVDAYTKMAKESTHDHADYVFIVPWITSGGADKVLIDYCRAITDLRKGAKITVITTLNANNTWRDMLPAGVDVLDFGRYTQNMDERRKDKLFTMLIVQLRPTFIHIINSQYGVTWAKRHKALMCNQFKLGVSLFAWGYLQNTDMKGRFDFADNCTDIDDIISYILTDNSVNSKRIVSEYGYSSDKITTLHQPVSIKSPNRFSGRKKNRVLWAHRISFEKNPGILNDIAERMPNIEFDVYGREEPGYDANEVFKKANIHYMGPFDDSGNLPVEDYDVFLMTSLTEGMPNIILEMASYGLPIIASNVGGVADFVEEGKTGLLVQDSKNVDEYVAAIEKIMSNDRLRRDISINAYRKVKENYSWEQFKEAMRSLI